MNSHDLLLERAKDAASRLHGDTSVSQRQTVSSLEELKGHIEILIDAVESDLANAGE